MHKDATLIAQHRRPIALFALVIATLVGCREGVDVAVVGIPADTVVTVSVDSLNQEPARSPSKVYRCGLCACPQSLPCPELHCLGTSARRLRSCCWDD